MNHSKNYSHQFAAGGKTGVVLACSLVCLALLTPLSSAWAQVTGTVKTLSSFSAGFGGYSGTSVGYSPGANLLRGADGNFYGTTESGGAGGAGTIFQITSAGVLTTLHSFIGEDGSNPEAALIQGTDGNFYGTTYYGGANNTGTAFRCTPAGVFTVLHSFGRLVTTFDSFVGTNSDGAYPETALVQAADGNFYGTTLTGGANDAGTVYQVTPAGAFTPLVSLAASDEDNADDQRVIPSALTLGPDGNLYGTTYYGGTSDDGTVFQVTTAGVLTTIYNFGYTTTYDPNTGDYTTTGSSSPPEGGVTLGPDGNLYGTTQFGGTGSRGTVFQVTTAGAATTVYNFSAETYNQTTGLYTNADGGNPVAPLLLGADGNLYSVTNGGGPNGAGTIFRVTTAGALTVLYAPTTGFDLQGLVQGTDGNFYGDSFNGGTSNDGTVFQVTAAGTFTILHGFGNNTSIDPSGLVQGADGNFYGVTPNGGTNNNGTIFQVTAAGVLNIVYNFTATTVSTTTGKNTNADGVGPAAALLRGTDGNFYGTTASGGANGSGTVFKVTPAGALTTLYSFGLTDYFDVNTDGADPVVSLIQGTDGNFYGTTQDGGPNAAGTVFQITPAGVLTTLYDFSNPNHNDDDGNGYYDPVFPSALIQAADGNFYGTTSEGGTFNDGVAFQITPAGAYTPLYTFTDNDGRSNGPLVQGADGNFYGTFYDGVFQLTPAGVLTDFAEFKGTNLSGANAGLIRATDGNFYGTTSGGGAYDRGAAFQLTPTGVFSTVYSFGATLVTGNSPDGAYPYVGVIQGADGNFYGTTSTGGGSGTGTVYQLTVTGTGGPVNGTQPTISLTSPPTGVMVVAGALLPLAANVVDPGGLLSQVQFMVNNVTVATVTASPYTFDATAPATPGTYTVAAMAVDKQGRTNTSSVTITVLAATATAPPSADVLTPADGRTVAAGSTVPVVFSVDTPTDLAQVSLYADGMLVTTFNAGATTSAAAHGHPTRRDATGVTSNLFQTTYTMPGTDKIVNLIAVAIDKLGQTSVTKVANIHGIVTLDKAPVVALGNVTNSMHVKVGSSTAVTVTASDPDASAGTSTTAARRPLASRAALRAHRQAASTNATLANVQYYVNNTLVGQASAGPFGFTFTPTTPGEYVLTAVATDGSNLATISTPVTMVADAPPTVSIVAGAAAVEGGAVGTAKLTRTGDLTAAIIVHLKTKGPAKAGVDYKALPATVTIPAGAASAKIKIKPIDGSPNAATLKIKIAILPAPDNTYELGSSAVATVKLVGD